RHELRGREVLRLRGLVARPADVARVQLVLELRGLPGPPHGHALPPRGGGEGGVPAHAQRLGRRASAHVRDPAREPPAGRPLGRDPGRAPPLARRPRSAEARRRMIRAGAGTPGRDKTRLKAVLFVGGSVLVVAVFLLTQTAVSRLTREVSATSKLLASVAAQATLPSTINPQLRRVLGQMQAGINFPIVISDTTGIPRAWSRIAVRTDEVPDESLDSLGQGLTISPVIREKVDLVRAEIPRMDRAHPAIPLRQTPAAPAMGYLHY